MRRGSIDKAGSELDVRWVRHATRVFPSCPRLVRTSSHVRCRVLCDR